MAQRFKFIHINHNNMGTIPKEVQYNNESSIATIIPANVNNTSSLSLSQSSKLLLPSSNSSSASGLGLRSDAAPSKAREESTSTSAYTPFSKEVQYNNESSIATIIPANVNNTSSLSLSQSSKLLLPSSNSSSASGLGLRSDAAPSQAREESTSTSAYTPFSSFPKPKSTHEFDKKRVVYAFNLLLLLKEKETTVRPIFKHLYLLFDYIVQSMCSVVGKIKLDLSNKIQHCLADPLNLQIMIKEYKRIGLLPNNYESITASSYIAQITNKILNSQDITTTSSGLTKISVTNTDQLTLNYSSNSLDNAKMTDIFYSVRNLDSDTNKHKKLNLSSIGSINIYKTIKCHLDYNNIKSKFFTSEELIIVTEIFNETELLLFPIISIQNNTNVYNNNTTFFNCLATKMKVDIIMIEKLILQYIEKNINNTSFLSTVYNPEVATNIDNISLLQKQLSILEMIINFDIKTKNITNISLPFILNNFSNIFPNYEIVIFSCKDDKIKDILYSGKSELRFFDADKSTSIAIMHYDDVYKLLQNMTPNYMYINDSDENDNL